MPSRTYKATKPTDECVTCRDGIARWETLREDFMTNCPSCSRPVHVAIVPGATVGAMDPRLASDPLYMSQLARFPGDPKAYVSGPHSWQKRVDQAKREGGRVFSNAEVADERSPKEIKRDERESTL